MFDLLRNKLKLLKRKADDLKRNANEVEHKIKVSGIEKCSIIEIQDYVTIFEYTEEIKVLDTMNISDKISFNIMWNSMKQKVNKGTYYVIVTESGLYNILIDGDDVVIDERTKNNCGTDEKIIRYDSSNKTYRYTSFKHDKDGSTFFVKFYAKEGVRLENFELGKKVAFQEICSVLDNLKEIDVINDILDLSDIEKSILEDFELSFQGVSKKKE